MRRVEILVAAAAKILSLITWIIPTDADNTALGRCWASFADKWLAKERMYDGVKDTWLTLAYETQEEINAKQTILLATANEDVVY